MSKIRTVKIRGSRGEEGEVHPNSHAKCGSCGKAVIGQKPWRWWMIDGDGMQTGQDDTLIGAIYRLMLAMNYEE